MCYENCPVCNQNGKFLFNNKILDKYFVDYFQCNNCGLVYTEKPYWLNEAYSDAILDIDTGVMVRNIENVNKVSKIINTFYNKGKFLDYAGGYGIFVRMMRDYGYNFTWKDKYATNLLAKGFEYNGGKIELITCFEAFEHFLDPLTELKNMFSISNDIIFSTSCYDLGMNVKDKSWEYYYPQAGQHIMFYSKITLEFLAKKYGVNYYKIMGLHWFSKRKHSKVKLFIINVLYKICSLFKHINLPISYKYCCKDSEFLMRNKQRS